MESSVCFQDDINKVSFVSKLCDNASATPVIVQPGELKSQIASEIDEIPREVLKWTCKIVKYKQN